MGNGSRPRTSYIVLHLYGEGWKELAEVPAHSAQAACVEAARGHLDPAQLDQGVQLHAVTARAWRAGHQHLKARHETRIVTT